MRVPLPHALICTQVHGRSPSRSRMSICIGVPKLPLLLAPILRWRLCGISRSCSGSHCHRRRRWRQECGWELIKAEQRRCTWITTTITATTYGDTIIPRVQPKAQRFELDV